MITPRTVPQLASLCYFAPSLRAISLFFTSICAVVPLTDGLAQQTTADGTQWTDYVVPGTQSGGPPPTYPYQPLFNGAPGSTGICRNGSIGSDSAWYRVCKCYGADGCFVTYESIASYDCRSDDKDWTGQQRFWVITATGRTNKRCGKIGVQRTVEIYSGLGKAPGYEGNYTWNPGPFADTTYPGDADIARLDTGTGDRPDENSKKAEDKPGDTKDTAKDNPKDQKPLKTETGKTETGKTVTPGTGTGQVEKRPRKEVKHKTTKHRRAKIDNNQPASSGGMSPETAAAISTIIDVGVGIGLSRSRGHTRGREGRDDAPRRVTPKMDR